MAGEDFVHVKLSAAGEKLAGEGGTVQIANGRSHFTFKSGEAQRIARAYDWNHFLQHERVGGEPLFEIAPPLQQPKEEPHAPEPSARLMPSTRRTTDGSL